MQFRINFTKIGFDLPNEWIKCGKLFFSVSCIFLVFQRMWTLDIIILLGKITTQVYITLVVYS